MTWMLQDEAANPYLDACQYAAKSNEFFSSDSESLSISERLFSSLELSLSVLFKT